MNRMNMEAPPFPLSSRAKPRDLQFYKLVLEVFRGGGLGFEACTADRQTSTQPGRAGTSIPQHWPSTVGAHTFTSTCIRTLSKNISRTSL